MIEVTKIWIFEIHDGACGGFIIADTEEEARIKLSFHRKRIKTEEDSIVIYPITALDLNRDVHDLW